MNNCFSLVNCTKLFKRFIINYPLDQIKNPITHKSVGVLSIPAAGVEPARPCGHRILSPARLPIPPRRRNNIINYNFKTLIMQMEAPTGFEPVIKVLQTSALPLGYGAAQCSI